MFPVYLKGCNGGLTFEEFKNSIVDICSAHQVENRASAFALIIYNLHDAHLNKMLFDEGYWRGLDELSGRYLTVFSLMADTAQESIKRAAKTHSSKMSFNTYAVKTDGDLPGKYQELIADVFGDSEFTTPAILFFQVENSSVTRHFFVELKEDSIEPGYNEIKYALTAAVDAVSAVDSQFKTNYDQIFEMIEISVKSSVRVKKIKKAAGQIFALRDLFFLIIGGK